MTIIGELTCLFETQAPLLTPVIVAVVSVTVGIMSLIYEDDFKILLKILLLPGYSICLFALLNMPGKAVDYKIMTGYYGFCFLISIFILIRKDRKSPVEHGMETAAPDIRYAFAGTWGEDDTDRKRLYKKGRYARYCPFCGRDISFYSEDNVKFCSACNREFKVTAKHSTRFFCQVDRTIQGRSCTHEQ